MTQEYKVALQGNKGILQGNGFLDGCTIEFNAKPVLPNEDDAEQTRIFNEIVKEAQQRIIHILLDGDSVHRPTGPIIESMLAEKSEEDNG